MGKRLIIKGADFSANGIHVAAWTKVLEKTISAPAFSNGALNVSANFAAADTALGDATHAKITFVNWPSDVIHRQYRIMSKPDSSYLTLLDPTPVNADTMSTLDSTNVASVVSALSNPTAPKCMVQSEGSSFTNEEQTKIMNANVSIRVEFYEYEE